MSTVSPVLLRSWCSQYWATLSTVLLSSSFTLSLSSSTSVLPTQSRLGWLGFDMTGKNSSGHTGRKYDRNESTHWSTCLTILSFWLRWQQSLFLTTTPAHFDTTILPYLLSTIYHTHLTRLSNHNTHTPWWRQNCVCVYIYILARGGVEDIQTNRNRVYDFEIQLKRLVEVSLVDFFITSIHLLKAYSLSARKKYMCVLNCNLNT